MSTRFGYYSPINCLIHMSMLLSFFATNVSTETEKTWFVVDCEFRSPRANFMPFAVKMAGTGFYFSTI